MFAVLRKPFVTQSGLLFLVLVLMLVLEVATVVTKMYIITILVVMIGIRFPAVSAVITM